MTYRIFGAEVSPYSIKVRSYFRYKGIDHEWIIRDQASMPEFQQYAKLPLIPLVVTPNGEGIQDSTPILEKVEAAHPEPSIHPDDPKLAFLSALIEEFGDEWGNKWMFHYRWAREADQQSAGRRIAETNMPDADEETIAGLTAGIVERMTQRVWFVGSSEQTAPQIEASYQEGLQQLEAHLVSRPYLFGERPSFGDFGLWGQIYNAWSDPTAGDILRRSAPNTVAWVERMLTPAATGDWESADTLLPTLEPLLTQQVGALFLPWSDANARAIEDGEESFECALAGHARSQKPQKYHARSLAALRKRYAGVADDAALEAILDRTDCRRWLA